MAETLYYYPTGDSFVIPRPLPQYKVFDNWIVAHLKHGKILKICTIPLDCEGCQTQGENSSCFEISFTASIWSVKLTVTGTRLVALVSFSHSNQSKILVIHLDKGNRYEEYPGFGSNFDIKAIDGDILYTVHCIYSYQAHSLQQAQPFLQGLPFPQGQHAQLLQHPQTMQSNVMQSLQLLFMPQVLEQQPSQPHQVVIPGISRQSQQIQPPRPIQRPRWPQQVQQEISTGNTVVTGLNLRTRQQVFRHQMRSCFRDPALSKIYDGSLAMAARDPHQDTYEVISIPDELVYLSGQGYATDLLIKRHGIFYVVDEQEKYYSTFYGETYLINLEDNDLGFPQEHLTIVASSDNGDSIWVSNSFDDNDRYFIKYRKRYRQKSSRSFV